MPRPCTRFASFALVASILLVQQLVPTCSQPPSHTRAATLSSTWASETEERIPTRQKHHHCIHEEKVREFEATVDQRSVVNPQRLFSHTTGADQDQRSWVLESFLDTLGLSTATFKRSLTSSVDAITSSALQPIRIAFDLSKLTR